MINMNSKASITQSWADLSRVSCVCSKSFFSVQTVEVKGTVKYYFYF